MESAMKELELLVAEKVKEGVFNTPEHAVEIIRQWIDQFEKDIIYERMRSEDA